MMKKLQAGILGFLVVNFPMVSNAAQTPELSSQTTAPTYATAEEACEGVASMVYADLNKYPDNKISEHKFQWMDIKWVTNMLGNPVIRKGNDGSTTDVYLWTCKKNGTNPSDPNSETRFYVDKKTGAISSVAAIDCNLNGCPVAMGG